MNNVTIQHAANFREEFRNHSARFSFRNCQPQRIALNRRRQREPVLGAATPVEDVDCRRMSQSMPATEIIRTQGISITKLHL